MNLLGSFMVHEILISTSSNVKTFVAHGMVVLESVPTLNITQTAAPLKEGGVKKVHHPCIRHVLFCGNVQGFLSRKLTRL